MIDLADIRRDQVAAREFAHTVGAVAYTLRTPTAFEVDCAAGDAGGLSRAGGMVRAQRAIIEQSIVGWQGLTVAMLLPAGHKRASDEAVPWSADAVPLLLDAQPDLVDELWPLVSARLVKRGQDIEAARKN